MSREDERNAARRCVCERVRLSEGRRAARDGAQPLVEIELERPEHLPGDERGAGAGDRRGLRTVVAVDEEIVRGAQVEARAEDRAGGPSGPRRVEQRISTRPARNSEGAESVHLDADSPVGRLGVTVRKRVLDCGTPSLGANGVRESVGRAPNLRRHELRGRLRNSRQRKDTDNERSGSPKPPTRIGPTAKLSDLPAQRTPLTLGGAVAASHRHLFNRKSLGQ